MNDQGFGGPQVCALIGITYRQLDYWDRSGLLRPSLESARGSGSRRRYSYRDLVALKVIKQLRDAGVSLQAARKAIDFLETQLGSDLASSSLVVMGSDAVIARTGEELVDLMKGGHKVFNVLSLSGVVEELDAAIHEIVPQGNEQTAERQDASQDARGQETRRQGSAQASRVAMSQPPTASATTA
jgi:DNA-binding transcriptional MerR regulator